MLLAASLRGRPGPLATLVETTRKRGALVYAFVGETNCILASHADYVVPIAPHTRTPFDVIAGSGRGSLLAFDEAVMIYLDAVLIALGDVLGIDPQTLADRAGDD